MKITTTIFLILFFYSNITIGAVEATEEILTECMTVASNYNKGMPMNVGNGYTVTAFGCKTEENKVVIFYSVSVKTESNKLKNINNMKISKTNMSCTSPNIRKVLDIMDVEWMYYNSSSNYMGNIKVKIEDCL
jgi:hypothetical protein